MLIGKKVHYIYTDDNQGSQVIYKDGDYAHVTSHKTDSNSHI